MSDLSGTALRAAAIALACAVATCGCAASAAPVASDVSLINLIASPAQYHGKTVRLVGVLVLAHERNALYLHQEDMENHISLNAVWLSLSPDGSDHSYRGLSGRYVFVEGRFDQTFKGHWGRYSGSIRDITRVEAWQPPPAGPLKED
jgi:hypothetical protein